jgi:uncharacterized protein YbjT (DUF2867 family)
MTATLIGATGLIGGYLLEELLKDDYFDTVRILIRRPVDFTHPKLEKKLVDFSNTESFRLALEESDVVFCAIGTTQKKVKGDKAAYRKVDYDIPVNAARFCKMNRCSTFILVSSVGSNSKSKNFYLKLKGEVEDAVNATGIRSIHIMRPSMLLGDRKEFRMGEKIGSPVMKAISFLLPSKYKPVHGRDVAKAMIYCSYSNLRGPVVYEYGLIKTMSKCFEEYPETLKNSDQTKKNFEKKLKYELQIKIIEFIDDHQPGFVRCSFTDIENKEWFFIEKGPVVSAEYLDADSLYPLDGTIGCRVMKRQSGENNKEICTIVVDETIDDSLEEREYMFDVFSEQITEMKAGS